MRRLISMLAAGLLAAGTVLTGGLASAGTTAARHASCSSCTIRFVSHKHHVNYYLGTPHHTVSGTAVILKPGRNKTTTWILRQLGTSSTYVIKKGGLAVTSRASSPGADVIVETTGNSGSGFMSQRWNVVFGTHHQATFQNVKTHLYLRVRNSGPIMYQTVTTGKSATSWTIH